MLRCINKYTLNNYKKNEKFKDLRLYWTVSSNGPKPQILLSDMNLVEDALDRLPAYEDN